MGGPGSYFMVLKARQHFFLSMHLCGRGIFIVLAALQDDLNTATPRAVIMPPAEKVKSVSLAINLLNCPF